MNFKKDAYWQWGIVLGPIVLALLAGVIVRVNDALRESRAEEASSQTAPTVNETICEQDTDCACGTHVETGKCVVGHTSKVDQSTRPCPDFCSGIAGHLETKCVEGECKQVTRKPSTE